MTTSRNGAWKMHLESSAKWAFLVYSRVLAIDSRLDAAVAAPGVDDKGAMAPLLLGDDIF